MATSQSFPLPRLDPSWVAVLEDGSIQIGKPAWLTSQNKGLPDSTNSDWRRLMTYCTEEKKRIKRLTLFVPGYAVLCAPEGRGAYGYFEQYIMSATGRGGCTALGICYPEDDGRGNRIIKVELVTADGRLEHWIRRKWQGCMIGDPEWKPGKDDGRPHRDGGYDVNN